MDFVIVHLVEYFYSLNEVSKIGGVDQYREVVLSGLDSRSLAL